MTASNGKAEPGESFVPLPRDVLASAAWRSLSINSRRLLDFLMIEHAKYRGKHNGELLAPRRQLEAFGIHAHLVSEAIDDAERVGLIDVRRGVGRAPSYYGLTWLPRGENREYPPTNHWRLCAKAAVDILASRKTAKTRRNDRQSAAIKRRPATLHAQGGS